VDKLLTHVVMLDLLIVACKPKYRVAMLTREKWTSGPWTHPVVKGLALFTNGSRRKQGTGAGVYGQYVVRKLSISLGKYATVSKVEIYAILACASEIQMNVRPEKYVSIYSDSQAALKAIQAVKAMSPLVRQCQKSLNISTQHTVGLYWVPGHAGV